MVVRGNASPNECHMALIGYNPAVYHVGMVTVQWTCQHTTALDSAQRLGVQRVGKEK